MALHYTKDDAARHAHQVQKHGRCPGCPCCDRHGYTPLPDPCASCPPPSTLTATPGGASPGAPPDCLDCPACEGVTGTTDCPICEGDGYIPSGCPCGHDYLLPPQALRGLKWQRLASDRWANEAATLYVQSIRGEDATDDCQWSLRISDGRRAATYTVATGAHEWVLLVASAMEA